MELHDTISKIGHGMLKDAEQLEGFNAWKYGALAGSDGSILLKHARTTRG